MQRSLLFMHKTKATVGNKEMTTKRVEFQMSARKKANKTTPPPKKVTKDQNGPFKSCRGLVWGSTPRAEHHANWVPFFWSIEQDFLHLHLFLKIKRQKILSGSSYTTVLTHRHSKDHLLGLSATREMKKKRWNRSTASILWLYIQTDIGTY